MNSGDTEADRRGTCLEGTPTLWWWGKLKFLKRGEFIAKSTSQTQIHRMEVWIFVFIATLQYQFISSRTCITYPLFFLCLPFSHQFVVSFSFGLYHWGKNEKARGKLPRTPIFPLMFFMFHWLPVNLVVTIVEKRTFKIFHRLPY